MDREETAMVRLLDEGTTAYRPAPGVAVADGVYRLGTPPGYDPDDEVWEFPPGSTVRCERRQLGGRLTWTAVAATPA